MVLTEELKNKLTEEAINQLSILFTHGAVGDNNTLPTSNQTTLVNEVFRKALEPIEINPTNILASLFISTTDANSENLVEVGYFDDDTTGNMWLRDLFDETLKTSDINLYLDAEITVEVVEVE